MKLKLFISAIAFLFSFNSAFSQKNVRDSLKEFTMNVIQKAIDKGQVKKIAVWDFTDMNKEVSSFGSYISELFSIYAENVESLELMDRQNLKSVLREHKLKSEGFIDKNTIMELGKFAEVDAVAVGSVIMADRSFQILVKIIETSSGRTVSADEQYFQIDKNMASTLGIEFTDASSTNNNTANRGYNRPINSNEQYNNSATVKKECEANKTGDFCFFNSRKTQITLFFCDANTECHPLNYGAEYIILNPQESKCQYDLSANMIYSFKVYSAPNNGIDKLRSGYSEIGIIDQGKVKIESCKSKTYTIR